MTNEGPPTTDVQLATLQRHNETRVGTCLTTTWHLGSGEVTAPVGEPRTTQLLGVLTGTLVGPGGAEFVAGSIAVVPAGTEVVFRASARATVITLSTWAKPAAVIVGAEVTEPLLIAAPTPLTRSIIAFMREASNEAPAASTSFDRYALDRFSQAMLAVLALKYANQRDWPERKDIPMIARGVILARLDDPSLDLAAVADACSVTPRTLEREFARRGLSTVRSMIREARVDHAVELLTDPALAGVSLGEIATRCGLSNASSLARMLRNNGHLSPAQLRRSALG